MTRESEIKEIIKSKDTTDYEINYMPWFIGFIIIVAMWIWWATCKLNLVQGNQNTILDNQAAILDWIHDVEPYFE